MTTNRDLSLAVGACLWLEKRSGQKYLVELIGYRIGEGVIVTLPEESDGRTAVMANEPVVIRYMGAHSRYAFESVVTQVSHAPFSHLHLAYPGTLEQARVRREARVPIELADEINVSLHLNEKGRNIPVKMTDISLGGARLVADSRLAKAGELFTIEIPAHAAKSPYPLELNCRVRHVVEPQRDGTAYQHGVEFEGLDDTTRNFIARFIQASG